MQSNPHLIIGAGLTGLSCAYHLGQDYILIEKENEKLNDETIQWLQHFLEQLTKEKVVGEKFIRRIYELMKEEPLIENNEVLQKRIQDAANYFFLPLLTALKDQLQKHPIITEHKEAAAAVDETLLELLVAFVKSIYFLQYCKQPFAVAEFLKHKLNLAIPRLHISSYAANKKQLAASDIPHAELYYTLKNWRDKICEERNLPIYIVANSASLKDICTYLPFTKQHLQLLNGFGKAKADKYGDEIISMVQDYCNQHGLESHIELKIASPKTQRKEPSVSKSVPSGLP